MPAASLPAAKEETVWKGNPSWKILLGNIIVLALVAIVLPAILYFLVRVLYPADVEQASRFMRIGWIVVGLLIAWNLVSVIIAFAKLKATLYTVTNQRVIIEQGLFSKTVGEIDLRYIDDTQFHQTFIHRLLGIGNVVVISADKMTPQYMLRGINDPRSLRELIRTHAYQVSHRQIFTRDV